MPENKIEFQIERLAFFSDAVFAIAITLLIIEVHPKVYGPEVSFAEALKEFLELLPELVAVVVSFFLISMHWRRHHQLFGVLKNYDPTLITLNFFALLSVIFIPFSTGFVAKNWLRFWTNPLTLPFVIYSFNNLACAFFNYLVFRYALSEKRALYDAECIDAQKVKLEVLFAVFVFAITTVVGIFNHFIAIGCFALFMLEPLFLRALLREPKGPLSESGK
jgi:uncharacterized membrane protein